MSAEVADEQVWSATGAYCSDLKPVTSFLSVVSSAYSPHYLARMSIAQERECSHKRTLFIGWISLQAMSVPLGDHAIAGA
jgi:hypothetical protein